MSRWHEMHEHGQQLARTGRHEHMSDEAIWEEIDYLVQPVAVSVLREHCTLKADPWHANVWGLMLPSGEAAAIYWRCDADVETGTGYDNLRITADLFGGAQ